MLQNLTIPAPESPQPIEGYGLPTTPQLDWSFVSERMAAAQYYWINTADTDDSDAPQPHAAPLWGIWHGDRIHFDGSPQTRWARNLIAHPAIAVHPPDAENVVIIEGFRVALLNTGPLPWDMLAVGTLSAAAIFVSGLFYFRRMEATFADVA